VARLPEKRLLNCLFLLANQTRDVAPFGLVGASGLLDGKVRFGLTGDPFGVRLGVVLGLGFLFRFGGRGGFFGCRGGVFGGGRAVGFGGGFFLFFVAVCFGDGFGGLPCCRFISPCLVRGFLSVSDDVRM
jgi:hypothetical protein